MEVTLSQDEVESIKERFDMFDKRGDGKVEWYQIVDVLRACGLNPLTADVDNLIDQLQLQHQRVDFQTLSEIYKKIKNASGQATFEDMMEAFKTYDRDNAGTISAGQLRQLLVLIGDSLKEEEADAIVDKYEDQDNGTGTINYHGMITSLMNS